MYKNHLIELKESEINMLSQHLEEKEELERVKREEMGSQQDIKGAKPGAKDAKKDAKAAPKAPVKGGPPPGEDKNRPQEIEIEYPEIESNHNFIIMEQDFMDFAKKQKQTVTNSGKQSKSSGGALATQSVEDKRAQRLKELLDEFQIIRSLPYSVAVNMQLNKPKEEVKVEVEAVVEDKPQSVDPKKAPAKGRKK